MCRTARSAPRRRPKRRDVMTWLKTVTAGLLIAATAGAAHAQVATKKQLTIEGARQIIAAAAAEAGKNRAGGVIAVGDDGGNLMALERLDGTFAAGGNISPRKARPPAIFNRPSQEFHAIIKYRPVPHMARHHLNPM